MSDTRRDNPDPTIRRLGLALVAIADTHGWSQRELARQIGMSPSGLNAIVKGYTMPKPPMLRRMAEALRVPLSALFRDETSDYADMLDIAREIAELDDEAREHVMTNVRMLRSRSVANPTKGRGARTARLARREETPRP